MKHLLASDTAFKSFVSPIVAALVNVIAASLPAPCKSPPHAFFSSGGIVPYRSSPMANSMSSLGKKQRSASHSISTFIVKRGINLLFIPSR